MNDDRKTICLITSGHLTSTPRLLKEADALHAAGYRVHVIYSSYFAPHVPLDERIARTAGWESTAVPAFGGAAGFVRKLRRKLAQKLVLSSAFANPELAAWAHHSETMHLADAATRIDAHYYIGHCLAALPAAALAAERTHAKFGFDIEDFHDAETHFAATDPVQRRAARIVQGTYLPRASHLTAASPLIAAQYQQHYGVAATPVLNVFPLADAPAAAVTPGPVSPERPARLYWFSQTIGPQRGLEAVVEVMARMATPVELHLRGHLAPGFDAELQARHARAGGRGRIVYLPFAETEEMVRLAAGADLGLSTEQREPFNRDICLTNKVFVYLLAGLPQLMTNTQAQSALAAELGVAALVTDFADAAALARQLDDYFARPERVAAARDAAWRLGQERFNWDAEQKAFLRLVRKAVGNP